MLISRLHLALPKLFYRCVLSSEREMNKLQEILTIITKRPCSLGELSTDCWLLGLMMVVKNCRCRARESVCRTGEQTSVKLRCI